MKERRVAVLGAGRIGRVIAAGLAELPAIEVTAFDASHEALQELPAPVRRGEAIIVEPTAIAEAVAPFDLVVGALPSAIAFNTMAMVLAAGVPIVDVSFMADDARELHEVATEMGVTAIYDAGVAPGLSNVLAASFAGRLAEVDSVRIFVGGLPMERRLPFQYKAPFAPSDVLEEYTRPVQIIAGGRPVWREPLSEVESVEFHGLGTLEGFLTDGLRSLVDTIPAQEMCEKTLRYPGHAALMKAFSETGLFDEESIELPDGTLVSPRDVTSTLLFPHWEFGAGEPDVTIMRVIVDGRDADGQDRLYGAELVDEYDAERDESSMARTTGYSTVAFARLLLDGSFTEPGVHPPEAIAKSPELVERMRDMLGERDVEWSEFTLDDEDATD